MGGKEVLLQARLRLEMLSQRGFLFEWVPVCLALGIGAYFAIRFEPSVQLLTVIACVSLACLATVRKAGEAFGPLLIGLILAFAGFLLAAQRAHDVAGPVLGWTITHKYPTV